MRSEALKQPRPVKLRAIGVQQVHNVRPVIAFTFHDRTLGPEDFFGWAEVHRQPQQTAGNRMHKPRRIHCSDAIARAKDHVDTFRAAVHLP